MGLGSVEYPSLPTSAIYRPEEDGECGNEMPMLTATNTGVVGKYTFLSSCCGQHFVGTRVAEVQIQEKGPTLQCLLYF